MAENEKIDFNQQIKNLLEKLADADKQNSGSNVTFDEKSGVFTITFSVKNSVNKPFEFLKRIQTSGFTDRDLQSVDIDPNSKIKPHKITFSPSGEYEDVISRLKGALEENKELVQTNLPMVIQRNQDVLEQAFSNKIPPDKLRQLDEHEKREIKISSTIKQPPENAKLVMEYLKGKVDKKFPDSDVKVVYSSPNADNLQYNFTVTFSNKKNDGDFEAFVWELEKKLDINITKIPLYTDGYNADNQYGFVVQNSPTTLVEKIKELDHENMPEIKNANPMRGRA